MNSSTSESGGTPWPPSLLFRARAQHVRCCGPPLVSSHLRDPLLARCAGVGLGPGLLVLVVSRRSGAGGVAAAVVSFVDQQFHGADQDEQDRQRAPADEPAAVPLVEWLNDRSSIQWLAHHVPRFTRRASAGRQYRAGSSASLAALHVGGVEPHGPQLVYLVSLIRTYTSRPVQPSATVSTCSSPSSAHTIRAVIGTGWWKVCSGSRAPVSVEDGLPW